MPRQAFTFATEVLPGGRVELQVPIPEGSHVEVLILTQETDACTDLLHAAESSLGFWDNPLDDAEWNHA